MTDTASMSVSVAVRKTHVREAQSIAPVVYRHSVSTTGATECTIFTWFFSEKES